MKIKKFEDLECWQVSRELTKMIYEITKNSGVRKDFGLRDQIQRAAVSVMSNISEGFDSSSDAEFIRFLNYAKRSCSEVQAQLYVALDQAYIIRDSFNSVYKQAENCRKLCSGLIKYLRNSRQPRVASHESPVTS